MIIETGRVTNQKDAVLYEVVAKDGEIWGPFKTAQHAALFAASHWPDQQQDEERKGFGWDVQVAGLR